MFRISYFGFRILQVLVTFMPDQWKQISALYDAALRLPEDERADYLKKHAPNENVRLEVESLLAHEHSGEQLLESPAMEVAAKMMAEHTPVLKIGQTLGHYEIISLLGKGGMGEVYQAKDTKLGRDIAIKMLPVEFAIDSGRVERFQREARLLASLNHPNIAAIYGLEESGRTSFLVMELIEGDTLAERLKQGPIPIEESLKLALQIAEGLEAAHEKGVIHRDLKPANIKVTPEGKIKILDFGLAKAFAPDQGEAKPSDSPTISAAATRQGVILGTAAYMSPEQAKGKTVDKRADIWAFGVVLFEMLTGKMLFGGETVTETLAAVIKGEPDWSLLPQELCPRIRFMIERCLEKESKNRYSSISDVRVDIRKVLEEPAGIRYPSVEMLKPVSNIKFIMPWVIASIIILAIVAGFLFVRRNPPQPRDIVRMEHILQEGEQFNIPVGSVLKMGHTLDVSPDGRKILYSTQRGLSLLSLDRIRAEIIPGTDENPQSPFFSPDGEWIGFWSQKNNKLKKISVHGGSPVDLCDVDWVFGAQWCEDDRIIYGDVTRGIMRVSANSGTPEVLVEMGQCAFPQLLPDNKSILFTDMSGHPFMIVIQNLETKDRKDLFQGAFAHYIPTGHLVYLTGEIMKGVIMAVSFDPVKQEAKGAHIPVIDGMLLGSTSNSGTLAYIPARIIEQASGILSRRNLVWVDRTGNETPLNAPPDYYRTPKISPDGTKVALSIEGDNPDIHIWDSIHENMKRLTFKEYRDDVPIWTPDGEYIIFTSNRGKKAGIYRKAYDGTGETEELVSVQSGNSLIPHFLVGDGKSLVLAQGSVSGNVSFISQITIGDKTSLKPLLKEKYVVTHPSISPDRKYMAYAATESGNLGIYVCPFPDVKSGKWQISSPGEYAESPIWSPDGTELFYLNRDNVMAVQVDTRSSFSYGKPKALFKLSYVTGYIESVAYDIHPNGKRFLMLKEVESTGEPLKRSPGKINIVLNWFEELKEKVPDR